MHRMPLQQRLQCPTSCTQPSCLLLLKCRSYPAARCMHPNTPLCTPHPGCVCPLKPCCASLDLHTRADTVLHKTSTYTWGDTTPTYKVQRHRKHTTPRHACITARVKACAPCETPCQHNPLPMHPGKARRIRVRYQNKLRMATRSTKQWAQHTKPRRMVHPSFTCRDVTLRRREADKLKQKLPCTASRASTTGAESSSC